MEISKLFHVGVVVSDFERGLAELSELFGCEWATERSFDAPVRYPAGHTVVLRVRNALTAAQPVIELIEAIPGTLWTPTDSGIHHLGYWADDVESESARLEQRGWPAEVFGLAPGGHVASALHRRADGPRIELISSAYRTRSSR